MTEEREYAVGGHAGTPGWLVAVVVIVAILAGAGIGFGWTAASRATQTQQALTAEIQAMKKDIAHNTDAIQQRLAKSEEISTGMQGDLSVVTKRLRITQGELKKAREEAVQAQEESAKQLAALDTSVKGELANKASTEEVKAVNTEVTGVRTDLNSTRDDLKMARSELGTLIARNHEDVEKLRRLNERDYIEFTVAGKNQAQKVGNVTVELRNTNPKKNQFSVTLLVGDQTMEKRNRQTNEPIFFYMRGTRQPLELVINQVEKDKATGYLSIPKGLTLAASGN
jgi:septation ring formation regulator EzrA